MADEEKIKGWEEMCKVMLMALMVLAFTSGVKATPLWKHVVKMNPKTILSSYRTRKADKVTSI